MLSPSFWRTGNAVCRMCWCFALNGPVLGVCRTSQQHLPQPFKSIMVIYRMIHQRENYCSAGQFPVTYRLSRSPHCSYELLREGERELTHCYTRLAAPHCRCLDCAASCSGMAARSHACALIHHTHTAHAPVTWLIREMWS
ncbi:hypothetical protein N658DRAFT_242277 [Parathielavia hyrcaniae]|uniref:Secreted protein n=1 Tax=Parathielavia hyrcaniae TaxID=113614 RepID=A0AAN6T449_9PEZI|nr:hypothetical protein N658DRAFT_242277 [Parathielavia hyrcaniae]